MGANRFFSRSRIYRKLGKIGTRIIRLYEKKNCFPERGLSKKIFISISWHQKTQSEYFCLVYFVQEMSVLKMFPGFSRKIRALRKLKLHNTKITPNIPKTQDLISSFWNQIKLYFSVSKFGIRLGLFPFQPKINKRKDISREKCTGHWLHRKRKSTCHFPCHIGYRFSSYGFWFQCSCFIFIIG